MDNPNIIEEAPCIAACAINQDARDYVQLIARGRFEEAFQLVRSKNPFPASCGRICTRRCEEACRRSAVDEPIAIAWLKRFLADKDLDLPQEKPPQEYPEKIAIIGAGPAGLSAANDLALMGYQCVIFEELLEPGGMLSVGVPRYRLPRQSLDKDINETLSLGVELRTGVKIGKDLPIDSLFQEGFKAVFVAIGAHRPSRLNIPGEDLPGVIPALELFRKISIGGGVKIGHKVAIIGGGDTALDAARTALRIGAREASLVYRRSLEEMPCEEEGRREAEEEGIKFFLLAAPVEILGKNKVETLKCIRMRLGDPDSSGRRRPIPIPGSEFTLEVDKVLVAIGQSPELDTFSKAGIRITPKDLIGVDEETMATSRPGVFAGGDAVLVGGTLIEAVAHGKRAARAIHSYLRGEKPVMPQRPSPLKDLSPQRLSLIKRTPRERMSTLPVESRLRDFGEVELGYSDQLAVAEARRCLNCGAGAVVDPELCAACLTCVRVCPYDVPEISQEERVAKIGPDCQSCGICVVECPARAITLKDRYEDQGRIALERALQTFSLKDGRPRIITFLCQYDPHCAGLSQVLDEAGENVRAVEVSCVGKIDPLLILKAFEMGVDGVVVAACSPGDCPFQKGHSWAKKRFDHLVVHIAALGMERQRLQWFSPSPREQFLRKLGGMLEELKKLGAVSSHN
ncbi:MAG: FAD-dependent oxidoreductase [Candidatus Brocadiales bacterium]|nr:FAD-dependent oxidoreductase [Candidatus Brocadiales bacterium]